MEVREVPEPSPGPGQILLRVRRSSTTHRRMAGNSPSRMLPRFCARPWMPEDFPARSLRSHRPPPQLAILYSRTSMLQIPPEMLTWRTTPCLRELANTYEASRFLDTRTTFVTERQILRGDPAR